MAKQALDQDASLSTVPGGFGYQSAYISWTDDSGQTYWYYPDLVLSEKWTEDATTTEHPVEQGADVIDHVRVELVKCELTIFVTNEPIGANSFDDPGAAQNVSISGEDTTSEGTADQSQSVIAQIWNAELALKGAALAIGGVAGGAVGKAVGGKVGGVIGNGVGLAAGAVVGSLFAPHEVDTPTSIVAGSPPAPTIMGTANIQFFAQTEDYVQATIQLIAGLKDSAQIITVNGSKQSVATMVIESYSYTRSQDEGTGAEVTLGFKEVRFVQTQTVTAPSIPRAATPVKKGDQNGSDGSPAQQQSVAVTLANGGAALVSKIAASLGITSP